MPKAPPTFGFGTTKPAKAWASNKGTTTQRGYGWQHQKDRQRLLANEPLCRECAKANITTLATIADHVTPLAEGGARALSNLQPLCRACSDRKTSEEALRGSRAASGPGGYR